MKRILVLEGSPREKGNTALVTDWALAGLGRGLEVERVRVADQNIHGCCECGTCRSFKHKAGCGQDDDMIELYDRIVDCDLLVFTSPVFCWGVTGQLKNAVDRFLALLTGESLLRGKPLAVIITAGGDHYDGADLAVAMFRSLARFGGMNYVGHLVVAPCPERPQLRRNNGLRLKAGGFGRKLRASLD